MYGRWNGFWKHFLSTRSREKICNFSRMISGRTRNRGNLQIRSTTFNLIPSYRRNLSVISVWIKHTHTRTHAYWYRSSSISHRTRPYFKEEKQFRESSLRSVKNEVERKTSATEMSLSDAINDSRETRWFSRQMDAFVARISNVFLVPCRATKINLLDIFFASIDDRSPVMRYHAENKMEFSLIHL